MSIRATSGYLILFVVVLVLCRVCSLKTAPAPSECEVNCKVGCHIIDSGQCDCFGGFYLQQNRTCMKLENLALKKNAYQISNYHQYRRAMNASLSVDGNKDDNFFNYSCSHTRDSHPNPWWAVDLNSTYSIIGVNLTSRGDWVGLTNVQPTPGAALSLYNYTLCGQYRGVVRVGSTVYQSCARDLQQFRYVIIQTNSTLTTQKTLNMCEVEVYGFGCNPQCATGCHTTGERKCDGQCVRDYGRTPEHTCSKCDERCDPDRGCNQKGAGKCDGLCVHGYVITENHTCSECDVNCIAGCNSTGPGRCDGLCVGGFYPQNHSCMLLENLALKKNAYQISNHSSNTPATRSVDGIKITHVRADSCSQTGNSTENPWWAVDLNSTYSIIGVNLTSSRDHAPARVDSFIVGLTNKRPTPGQPIALYNYTICGQYPVSVTAGSTVYQPCDLNVTRQYRYVIIQINSSLTKGNVLVMCEVEVYGFECDKQCAAGCQNKGTGKCDGLCKSGYGMTAGNTTCAECDKRCDPGRGCNETGAGKCDGRCVIGYGITDNSTCSECDKRCDPGRGCNETGAGKCDGRCVIGYGITDNSTCSECDKRCDPGRGCNETGAGKCDGRCVIGYGITDNSTCSVNETIQLAAAQQSSQPFGAIAGSVLVVVLLAGVSIALFILVRRQKAGNQDRKPAQPSNDGVPTTSCQAVPGKATDCVKLTTTSSTSVRLEDLDDYIEQLKSSDEFSLQFKALPKDDLTRCGVSSQPENKKKNRYVNILPCELANYFYNLRINDETRVQVSTGGDGVTSDDVYINASFIKEYRGKEIAYIACQAPKEETIDTFWEMIWQQKVAFIVALVLTFEEGRNRCRKYWPDEVGETVTAGRYTIKMLEFARFPEFAQRKLSFGVSGKSSRTLTQFQYLVWPDKGVPENVWSLTAFRHRVCTLRTKQSGATGDDGKLLVHCSAGVGRTGTFMAMDILLNEAVKTGRIDVFDVVRHLRLHRMSCVQTKEQYQMLYAAVLDAYITGLTARSRDEFNKILTKLETVGSDQALEKEYLKLTQLRPVLPPDSELEALKPVNIDKNRNCNIVPISRLSACVLPIGSDGSDYINASMVKGYKMPTAYILTQLPLYETISDFWKLIVTENCTSVVQLQRGSAGDPPFYPKKEGDAITYGETAVVLKSTRCMKTATSSIVLYTFDVTGTVAQANVTLQLRVHELTSWNQVHNTPNSCDDVLQLITLVNEWERQQPQMNSSSDVDTRYGRTVVVQCHDGATRSGLYAATSQAIDRLKCDDELDVFLSCRYVTSVRPQTITSQAQYNFIYQAAIKSLTPQSSITVTDDENNVPEQEHIYGNINPTGPSVDDKDIIYPTDHAHSQGYSISSVSTTSQQHGIYANYLGPR